MSFPTWDEQESLAADELYLDGRVRGAHDHQRGFYAGMFPETFYRGRSGAGSRCYAGGGALYGPDTPMRGHGYDDIDTIIARLLEGYRILDELFNPRCNHGLSARKDEHRRPEARSMPSDQTES